MFQKSFAQSENSMALNNNNNNNNNKHVSKSIETGQGGNVTIL
jgi:hypothetical protein